MIRIAICCGEGFSSGFLSRHLAKSTMTENLQNEVSFIFIPFFQLYDRQDEADIAMYMPQVEPKVLGDKREYKIPLYPIPYKVVIKPTARDYLEDAEDILALANGKGGYIRFMDEERTYYINRLESHRKYISKKKKG